MTGATATPRLDRTIRLQDGREMAYAEWGDPTGRLVILIHGAPGSRLFCPDLEATEKAGVRLLTIDRDGYGLSDPRPGRKTLDWPDDYIELATRLDLPHCPVIGWSAGGRYAMALAYRAPDRISRIGLAASVGPNDLVPNALDGFSLDERVALDLLRRDRPAGLVALDDLSSWFDGDGWESMFVDSWGEADDRVLADPTTLAAMRAQIREGARQGRAGFAADDVNACETWGFSVAELTQPVDIWVGGADTMVRSNHADYLAANIPGADRVTFPGEGHLIPIDHWAEMLAATG
jgi:pimeloyl-ACP methyl ester carboxylesterase